MKNITAFAVLVILFFALPVSAPVFGQSPDTAKERTYLFSAAPQFGQIYGQAHEIVYMNNTSDDIKSELLWDMKPLLYAGAAFDFSPADPMKRTGFFCGFSFKFGFPGKTGVIEDRDWLSTENNALTHFSSHTNETKKLYWLEAGAGISIPIKSLFLFRAYTNISYMYLAFTATDGYVKYAREKNPGTNNGKYYPIDDNPETRTFNREVLKYTQDWLIIAPGISLGLQFLEIFSFDLFFQISPLVFSRDFDEHLLRDLEFLDFARWGLFLEPRGRLTVSAAKRLDLSLEGAYRYMGGARGDTYQTEKKADYTTYYSNCAGTGLSIIDVNLTAKIRF